MGMRQVPVVAPPPPSWHRGYIAAVQSAFVAQTWRFPVAPHAVTAWHPPWQHAVPVAQSALVAHVGFVPAGHAPALHVVVAMAPMPMQHVWAVGQSAFIAQSCVPAGQVPMHAATGVPMQHT